MWLLVGLLMVVGVSGCGGNHQNRCQLMPLLNASEDGCLSATRYHDWCLHKPQGIQISCDL